MLDRDGETTRQMCKIAKELEAAEQDGGSHKTRRMGARAGKKKRKATSPGLEAISTRFNI
jgi:hypothetical protein